MTLGPRKTTNVCLKDFTFANQGVEKANQGSLEIFYARKVNVIFREEKNKKKWETTTQEATVNPLVSLGRVVACIVSDLWKMQGTSVDSPTCVRHDRGDIRKASAPEALSHLLWVAESIGTENEVCPELNWHALKRC